MNVRGKTNPEALALAAETMTARDLAAAINDAVTAAYQAGAQDMLRRARQCAHGHLVRVCATRGNRSRAAAEVRAVHAGLLDLRAGPPPAPGEAWELCPACGHGMIRPDGGCWPACGCASGNHATAGGKP